MVLRATRVTRLKKLNNSFDCNVLCVVCKVKKKAEWRNKHSETDILGIYTI